MSTKEGDKEHSCRARAVLVAKTGRIFASGGKNHDPPLAPGDN